MAMNCENLLNIADAYCAATGLKPSTVSLYMGGSGDTLKRLRGGGDLTSRRLETYLRWFAEHWPEDQPWPAGIHRPDPCRPAA